MEFNSTNALAQNQQLEAYKDVMAASEPQEVELSWEDVKDSLNRNQVAANVYSMMAGPEFVADPNYTVSPEDWERVTSDVPTELWDQYDEVRSKAELEHVHKELVEFNKRSQQRQALG